MSGFTDALVAAKKSHPIRNDDQVEFESAKCFLFSRRGKEAAKLLDKIKPRELSKVSPQELIKDIKETRGAVPTQAPTSIEGQLEEPASPKGDEAPNYSSDSTNLRGASICRWLSYSLLNVAQLEYLKGGRTKNTSLKERELNRERRLSSCIDCCRGAIEILRSNEISDLRSAQRESARTRIQLGYVYALLGHVYSSLGYTDARTQDDGYSSLATQALSAAESFLQDFPLHDDLLARGALELRKSELSLIRVSSDPKFGELRQSLREIDNKKAEQSQAQTVRKLDWEKHGALVEHVKDALHHAQKAKIAFQNHPNNLWWWNQYLVHRAKIEEIFWTLGAFGDSVYYSNLEQRFHEFVVGELHQRFQTRKLGDRFSAARILEALTNIWLLTKRDKLSKPIATLAKAWHSSPSKVKLSLWRSKLLEMITGPDKTTPEEFREDDTVTIFCNEVAKWVNSNAWDE